MSLTMKEIYLKEMQPLMAKINEAPWEDPDFYAAWLSQTYYYVSNSTRLIAFTGSLMEDNALHQRFIDHAKEERNHELLLVNDLKHLGRERLPEFSCTAAFYQSQVYWMIMKRPLAFFGYIFCLEGLAVDFGPKALSRATSSHGVKASSFIKVHCEEDEDHLEKAFTLVAKATPAELLLVQQNLRQSVGMYGDMLSACAQQMSAQVRRAA